MYAVYLIVALSLGANGERLLQAEMQSSARPLRAIAHEDETAKSATAVYDTSDVPDEEVPKEERGPTSASERFGAHGTNIWGQTGLRRSSSARVGPHGFWSLGVSARGFYVDDFVANGSDQNLFVGGTESLRLSILDIADFSLATWMATNENTLANPSTQFTMGDVAASLKLSYDLVPWVLGTEFQFYLPSMQNHVSADLGNFALSATLLATADLHNEGIAPLRLHANLGYSYQNARAISEPRYRVRTLQGFLAAMTANQWFYDQLRVALAAELVLAPFTPFVELWAQQALGFQVDGGYSDKRIPAHVTLTPGLRIQMGRGLTLDLAMDVGLVGTGGLGPFANVTNLHEGLPVNPPYAFHVGLSYTFAPFEDEPRVTRPPREPSQRVIRGCIKLDDGITPAREAIVDFREQNVSRVLVDEQGCFVSPPLSAGPLVIEIQHPDFEAQLESLHPDLDRDEKLQFSIRTPWRTGSFSGVVTDESDQRVEARVEVRTRTGESRQVMTEEGEYHLELRPGEYLVKVEADSYLLQGARINIRPSMQTVQDFSLQNRLPQSITSVEEDRIQLSSPIPFELGKARLLKAAEFILNHVADVLLSDERLARVEIVGHTDDSGSAERNQLLSEKRARAVRDYLIARGIAPSRLAARGMGAREPLASNDDAAGRARNRRVEFLLIQNPSESK